MWTCVSCRSEVDDNFVTCWSCGAGADGLPTPGFVREPLLVSCYVCDRLGEFAKYDEVPVCPDCVARTPPGRPSRLGTKFYFWSGIAVGLAWLVVVGMIEKGVNLPAALAEGSIVSMSFYLCVYLLKAAAEPPGASRWKSARRARQQSKEDGQR